MITNLTIIFIQKENKKAVDIITGRIFSKMNDSTMYRLKICFDNSSIIYIITQ